jgi:hypothetical protein
MEPDKSKKTLGFVFLACGMTFLCAGPATGLLALWAMAPALIALGVVFLAASRKRG